MICFLIHLVDVEHQICPVLIELCSIDSTDDFRTEAVTVSSCDFPYTLLPPFSQLILPHNYLPTHFYPPPFPLSSRFHFPILVLPFPVLPFYEKSFYFHYLLTSSAHVIPPPIFHLPAAPFSSFFNLVPRACDPREGT